jgi:hypothetical protein
VSVTTLFAEVALYGGIAAIISLTARGFRLYNLASGAWVVLGGWVWYWLKSQAGTVVPVDPPWFLLLAVIACIQVALPWILRQQLVQNQIAYVFATVGIALLLDGAAPALLLKSYSAVIGIQGSVVHDAVVVGVALAIVAFCMTIIRSARYAKACVCFRLDGGHRDARLLAGLVGCEIGLLLVLGAASSSVHHGLLSSSFFRSIVPVLALLMTGRRPVPTILIAGTAPAAAYLLGKTVPGVAGVSMPFVIGVLGCIAIAMSIRSGARRAGRTSLGGVLEHPDTWGLRNRNLRGLLALMMIGVILHFGFRLDAPDSANTVWMMALAVSGMLILGYLGVFTVSVPIAGALGAYAVISLRQWPLALCAALLLLGVAWVSYIFLLRTMQEDYAVVADLALILAIGYFIMSTSAISGVEGIRLFGSGRWEFGATGWAMATLGSGAFGMASVYSSSVIPNLRTRVVGLQLGESGRAHGAPKRLMLTISMSLAAAIGVAGSFAYYSGTGSIAANSMSLERGLAVMVLASLMLRTDPIIALVAVFALFTLIAGAATGMGTLVYAGLGLGLVIVACLPSRGAGVGDGQHA